MSCCCGNALWGGKCCGGPTIFNNSGGGGGGFVGYGTVYDATSATFGMSPLNSGTLNTAALQAAVNAALATSGGTIFIPAGIYQMAGTVHITGVGAPGGVFGGLLIQGSSGGTELCQNTPVDLFDVTNTGQVGPNNTGVRFRDLWLQYNTGVSSGIAINCTTGGASVTAEWCYFNNCPASLSAGVGGNALSCGLVGCTIQQGRNPNSVQVTFSAPQGFLIFCVIRQTPISPPNNGPTGCTGVLLQGTEGTYIYGCHISDFTTGISVTGRCLATFINHNEIQSYTTSISVVTPDPTASIYSTHIDNNYIVAAGNSTGPGTNGVIIGSATQTLATNVQGVFLTANTIVGWSDAGVLINGGAQIKINGGMIAQNGQNPTAANLGAGVVCTSALVNSVTVLGTALIGSFAFLGGGPVQPYAASLFGGCTEIEFNTCNMIGNGISLPVLVGGTPFHWYVINCRGYNKSNVLVANEANVPVSGVEFDATTIGPVPYLGPYIASWTGATVTHLKVSHDRSTLTEQDLGAQSSSNISLNPPQSMSLTYTGAFTTFKVLGN